MNKIKIKNKIKAVKFYIRKWPSVKKNLRWLHIIHGISNDLCVSQGSVLYSMSLWVSLAAAQHS